jgi:cyclopropane fatty-acyl-phospholipid synthase-like methyltransferase
MRSANAEVFNHDSEASGYDQDVRDEADPIRSAYRDVLAWVVAEAKIDSDSRVLELGSGTGNLSRLISTCRELIAIDVSEKMEAIAKGKVGHLPNRRFIKADLLEVFGQPLGHFDAVISTYTLHHLIEDEKGYLFQKIFGCLAPGGRAVFGDLMVQNEAEKTAKIRAYLSAGDGATVDALRTEFFWIVDTAVAQLETLGFQVRTRRFSDLSYAVVAEKAR